MTIDESMLYEMGYNRGFKDGIKGSIPKADYENRLKADLVAMFREIQLEIEELDVSDVVPEYQDGAEETKEYIANMIEQKINSLKAESGLQESEE